MLQAEFTITLVFKGMRGLGSGWIYNHLSTEGYEGSGFRCVWCVAWCVLLWTRLILFWFYKSGSFLEQINDHGFLKEDNLSVFRYRPICMCLLMRSEVHSMFC